MIITLLFVLFFVYVILRVWLFGKNKEWRDLTVFVVISALAYFVIIMPTFGWETGTLLYGEHKMIAPIARRLLQTVFGVSI
ncbi:hypothetical protein [Aneurinibacillus sp. REN35]|uniref:hypothetical protein n=1 Tax=Aneurinibacillus sp. REN35 TaxID=3237286 RepID=UPI0035275BF7